MFSGDEPARSSVLDAWLVPSAESLDLVIADDPEGREPWPTNAQAEQAALVAKEAERASKEAALAAKEAALAAKEAALSRVAELEAELARKH